VPETRSWADVPLWHIADGLTPCHGRRLSSLAAHESRAALYSRRIPLSQVKPLRQLRPPVSRASYGDTQGPPLPDEND
jgi:hypothetical protein